MAIICVSILATSCKRDNVIIQKDQISPAVLHQIAAQGFGTSDVQKIDEGYLV